MNKVIETISNRVSCRQFSDKKVPLGKLNQILEAGKFAPSGMNRQICHILVVRNKKVLEEIKERLKIKFNRECLYGAQTLCIVYGKKDEPLLVQDASCIIENMLISATALKIDSCWINQLEDLLSDENNQKLKKRLGIDENYKVIGSVALGYRLDGINIPVKPRKDDFIKWIK